MKTLILLFPVASLVFLLGVSPTAIGQTHASGGDQPTSFSGETQQTVTSSVPIASSSSAAAKIVGYRAVEWTSVHASNEDEATQILGALKKIGCEAKSEEHDDHVDVKFRCPDWRSMKVKSHALQSKWAAWCEAQGLETVVVNPPATTKRPTVAFRLTTPKTVHMHDVPKAKQILNTLTLVGCQVKTNNHDDHIDATFSCPEWTTIELADEESVRGWQAWLEESGFETKHDHIN